MTRCASATRLLAGCDAAPARRVVRGPERRTTRTAASASPGLREDPAIHRELAGVSGRSSPHTDGADAETVQAAARSKDSHLSVNGPLERQMYTKIIDGLMLVLVATALGVSVLVFGGVG